MVTRQVNRQKADRSEADANNRELKQRQQHYDLIAAQNKQKAKFRQQEDDYSD